MKKLTTIVAFLFISFIGRSQILTGIPGEGHVEVKPCETDTVKGIIYWHSKNDHNNGNAWDVGYWVGKCGPSGIRGMYHVFIPGKIKYTQVYQEAGSSKWKKDESVVIRGKFYDSQWNVIKPEDVYGLIVDQPIDSTSRPKFTYQKKGF